MPKTLLIDESSARDHLRGLLAAHPAIQVVGEADDLTHARSLLNRADYDMVFLGTRLGRTSGFELLPDVPAHKPVVFINGDGAHAAQAFEANAMDYLVKPVHPNRLAETLRRIEQRQLAENNPGPRPLGLDETIALNSGSHAHFIRVGQISLIEAEGNYTVVHHADGPPVMVRRSLKRWAHELPVAQFLRVHRTAIANIDQVASYVHDTPRTLSLHLRGVPHPVRVSRQATQGLKDHLHLRLPRIGQPGR